MRAEYPRPRPEWEAYRSGAAEMELVMAVIGGIRTIRGEMEVPPSREIAALLDCGSLASLKLLKHNEAYIVSLARLGSLGIGSGLEKPADASVQVAGDVQVLVPLKGLVDVEAEEKRLLKEIGKIDKEIELYSRKLENPSFIDRAPAEIVAKEREKLAEVTTTKRVLEESLEKIRRLK